MPVTLINAFVVSDADADAFLAIWTKTARAFAGAPGFISATLHRAVHENARFSFVNVALWESEDLYHAAFDRSPVPQGGPQVDAYPALYEVAVHAEAMSESSVADAPRPFAIERTLSKNEDA